MRVISLVPSWTETLIACGIEVVGRTRYCIHPAAAVSGIPVLGGTKQLDWSRWRHLRADLVVMDREENTQTIADECPFPVFPTHIRAVDDVSATCAALAERLENVELRTIGERWRRIVGRAPVPRALSQLPGVVDWWRRPEVEPRQCIYLIWRKPWMSIGHDTFIASMLTHLGCGWALPRYSEPYPVIELPQPGDPQPLLLFSTEPYPFERYRAELLKLPFPMALVDGEAFSWFGIRSLAFLERQREV